MVKRYADLAFLYGIAALCSGVFYREFTKFNAYYGKTSLAVLHTHLFLLGMFFFLALMVTEKLFGFTDDAVRQMLPFYHGGLGLACAGLLLRGTGQVLAMDAGSFWNACISGVSGLGHILLAVSLVKILLAIRKKAG